MITFDEAIPTPAEVRSTSTHQDSEDGFCVDDGDLGEDEHHPSETDSGE